MYMLQLKCRKTFVVGYVAWLSVCAEMARRMC